MADIVNLRKRAEDVTISQKQAGYSKVRIYAGTDSDGNDIVYEAGDDSGQILEIDNEFGTQVMAQNILNDIAGMQYQPGIANGALVDPAAEMGDSLSVNNNSIGMYIRYTNYGRLMKSNVEAPSNQEIEHEFAVDKSSDRQYKRFMNQTKSRLGIMSTEIDAKVSIQSQNDETGFGWSLLKDKWTVGVYQGTSLNPVFTVDENGVYIVGSGSFTGEISATGGTIGGLKITGNSIESANGNFRVDSAGNLTATNGTFAGAVYASNIKSTAVNGYGGSFSGAGLSGGSVGAGKIVPYDLSTPQFTNGVTTSLGYANFSNDVFNKRDTASYLNALYCYANTYYLNGASVTVNQHRHAITASSDGTVTIGMPDWVGNQKHSFNIADTQFYKDGVSAVYISATSGTSYSSSADRSCSITGGNVYYASQMVYGRINATLSNGKTQTIFVGMDASKAYTAGRNSVSQTGITTIYITMVSGNSVGVRAYHPGGGYAFHWLSTGDYWDGYN